MWFIPWNIATANKIIRWNAVVHIDTVIKYTIKVLKISMFDAGQRGKNIFNDSFHCCCMP